MRRWRAILLLKVAVLVLLLGGGAIVNVLVLWERDSEIYGFFGTLELFPHAPVWLRSAFNTVFYAVILWG